MLCILKETKGGVNMMYHFTRVSSILFLYPFISAMHVSGSIPPLLDPKVFSSKIIAQENSSYHLMQVNVLDQTAEGSSGGSCAYHALRNGTLLALASLLPEKKAYYAKLLFSAEHMRQKLGEIGEWRKAILNAKLHNEEKGDWIEASAIAHLIKNTLSKDELKNINCDIASYGDRGPASPTSTLSRKEAKKFAGKWGAAQITPEFKAIRQKIKEHEHFSAIVLIFLRDENLLTIACDTISDFASELKRLLLHTEDSLAGITEDLTKEGHWISLVVNSLNDKRQYIIADSLNKNRLHDPVVQDVIALLEGTHEKYSASPRVSIYEADDIQAHLSSEELLAVISDPKLIHLNSDGALPAVLEQTGFDQAAEAIIGNRFEIIKQTHNNRMLIASIAASILASLGLYAEYKHYTKKRLLTPLLTQPTIHASINNLQGAF